MTAYSELIESMEQEKDKMLRRLERTKRELLELSKELPKREKDINICIDKQIEIGTYIIKTSLYNDLINKSNEYNNILHEIETIDFLISEIEWRAEK